MKPRFPGIAISLVLAAFLGSGAAHAAGKCEPKLNHPPLARKGMLIAAINPTVAPLQYIDEDGNLKGLDVEFGNQIAERLCLEMFFQSMQFATMIPGLKEGRFDMIDSFMAYTPERAEQVIMLPYSGSSATIIVPKADTKPVTGVESFSGRRLAVETGTIQEADIRAANEVLTKAGKPTIDSRGFRTYAEVLQVLSAGQVDGAYVTGALATYHKQQGQDFFNIALAGLHPTLYALAFKEREMADAVAKVLNDMEADGSLPKLFKAYGQCIAPGPFKVGTVPKVSDLVCPGAPD